MAFRDGERTVRARIGAMLLAEAIDAIGPVRTMAMTVLKPKARK